MKINIYIIILFFPAVANAQQPRNNDSPKSYSWQYVGNPNFSYATAGTPSLAFCPADNQLYVAYGNLWNSDWAGFATVKKFNGTIWEAVGDTEFSSGQAQYTSLAFNLSSQPHVAYKDHGNSGKATVMKFDGTNWVNVGNAGFSQGGVFYTNLAFCPSDNLPYVAFLDSSAACKTSVMKFNGTNWVYVGNEGFSAGTAVDLSFAFCPSDSLPYVAFTDEEAKATVMKFNGSNWVTVGNSSFSSDTALYVSIAFSPSGQPYVAYSDYGNAKKATVMKFDGTNWVYVGNEGFSGSWANDICLVFNPVDAQPYVLFYSGSYPYYQGATLMTFNGTAWVYVGPPGFSNGEANSGLSLAFSPHGQPYAAFGDGNIDWQISVMKYDSVLTGINIYSNPKLILYPNPVSNNLTIDLSNVDDIVKCIEIDNLSGVKLIEKIAIDKRLVINVETLSSGIYLLKVKTKNSSYFRKICKI